MKRLTVFLHGFTGHADSWDDVIARLPPTEHALAITLSAHAFDPNPPPTTFEQEVDRIAQIIATERADHVRLCGYSLGGRIALGLLATHAELAASAVIVGANPGLATQEERRARASNDETWAQLAEREGPSAFADAWMAQPLFASQLSLPHEIKMAQHEKRIRHSGRALAVAMRSFTLAAMPNYWPLLPQIRTPIRFVVGELDTRFLEMGRRVVDVLPRAQLIIAPRCGHNVVLEAPETIVDALASLV